MATDTQAAIETVFRIERARLIAGLARLTRDVDLAEELSQDALVHYDCSDVYDAASDRALAWNDPDIGIAWPETPATVSEKDRSAPRLAELNF